MPDLPLPVDIPWKLVRTTEGMLDRSFCDGSRPPSWRPSVALFAYEPDMSTIPDRCGRRFTFLKVSVSVSGLQPPLELDEELFISSDVEFVNDVRGLNLIFGGQYLACYGVLLNVAVFPGKADVDPSAFPYIMDFEPKNRELVQAASQEGEMLTSSSSSVGTSKSFTRVSGTEINLSQTLKYTSPESQYGQFEGTTGIGGKWTNTATEGSTVQMDASRERAERYSTQTSLNQLFSLLTGYHVGTNRATFLMLPRPHTRQPTAFRTFVHGVRQIEGIQDFFIVVSRPQSDASMRVDLTLETGHFPEHVSIPPPAPSFTRSSVWISEHVRVQGSGAFEGRRQEETITRVVPLEEGWEIDPSRGEAGRGGVGIPNIAYSEGMHRTDLKALDFRVVDGQLVFSYRIERGLNAGDDTMTLRFEVFTRRPNQTAAEPSLGAGHFVAARTELCAGLTVDAEGCVVSIGPSARARTPTVIVDEVAVALPRHVRDASDAEFSRLAPPLALNTMRYFLARSTRQNTEGKAAGYAATRAFAEHLAKVAIPDQTLDRLAASSPVVSKRFERLGELTLRDFIMGDATAVAGRLAVPIPDLLKGRLAFAASVINPSGPLPASGEPKK
ncbi:MAG TPA: hypothetical protein VFU02_07190 [Polyangiaceae bacterium]|nr:hypothetical protein [Polyangiaceae bacterium]